MAVEPKPWRFSVADYHRMAAAGVLAEDDRVELIDGEILEMSPIGSRHAACVNRLASHFASLRGSAIVSTQNPVRIDERSEPQPDLALLRPTEDFYAAGHPGPDDILLLIEVADASLEYDRQVKVPLYGRAGIVEVWLVDLAQQHVTVYQQPTPGGYTVARVVRSGEALTPAAFPQFELPVAQIVG